MAQQAESVAIPKRLPLVIQPDNRDESTDKDAKLVNAYVEKSELTGEYTIFKRPGLAQTGSTLSGNGYGVYNWLGDIYAIFGATMYKNGVALVGALDTTGGVYRFSSCLGATPKLQFGNGIAAYNYDAGSGIVAIAGANFPSPSVKGWVYLDGTTYVMDADATIRGCDDLNDPSAWTDVLNTLTAQIEPDGGVYLAKQLVYAIALKEWSSEVFYDAANATGSPLGPVQGAKINHGCANQDSVQEIDGALLWVTTNRAAAPQIAMLDNLKFSIVSTKAIDRLLGEADFSDVYSFGIKYEGHRYYGITIVDSNVTLVYDIAERMWAQWTDTNGDYFPISATTFNSDLGIILQHKSNGKLYLMDYSYFTDDGSVITTDIYTPNFDGGVRRRKQLTMMEFVGDQTTGSVLQVRINDSDYELTKWSNFRRVDMAAKKPILSNCGTFMRRAWHIRHQCTTAMRLKAIELQIDIGTL